MKRKRIKTEKQKLLEENIYKIQDFEKPPNEEKRFVRISHYMLNNCNYKKLSSSAKVLLLYMLDWAFASDEYLHNKTFEFSTTMLTNIGVMSNNTTILALKDLQHYGFIRKANNAMQGSGLTQKWEFISDWYKGEKQLR